jgi:carboxylesterase
LGTYGVSSIAPLLPGHGTSVEELNRCSWRDWLRAADAALRDAQRKWVVIFVAGLSMGGSLALHLAARYSGDLAGAIVLATPLELRHPLLPFIGVLSHLLGSLPKRGTGIADQVAGEKRVSYDHQPLAGVVELTRLLRSLRKEIHNVRCPLFLAHSLRDQTIPFSNLRAIAEAVSSHDIDILTLERSNHVLPLDVEREELFRAIQKFVQSRSATPLAGGRGS